MGTVRVMVHEAWDEIPLPYDAAQRCGDLKQAALDAARVAGDPGSYEIKFRGAAIRDESRTLGDVGIDAGDAVIVLLRRRAPVR